MLVLSILSLYELSVKMKTDLRGLLRGIADILLSLYKHVAFGIIMFYIQAQLVNSWAMD